MKHLADQIATWLIEQGLPNEQKEIYSYGFECLANELIADILLFLSALLLHKIPEMFIWCLSFTILRVNLGGLHASSHSRCIFYSTVIGIFCVQICPYFYKNLPIMVVFSTLVCLIATFIAPVVHPNHPLNSKRKRSAHRFSCFISLAETFLLVVLYFFSPKISSCIFLGLASSGLLGGLGYLKNIITNHIN